jgi:hypothetical protein
MRPSDRTRVRKLIAFALLGFVTVFADALDEPAITVTTSGFTGPRNMEQQTKTAVVRDYLASWQAMSNALSNNDASLLDADFVGVAHEKLLVTITEQQNLQLRTVYTVYKERSHDIHLLFYSPEGLSVQLVDTVEYDVQLLDHGKLQGTQHVRTRYLAVLTPTEVRWKVRIFQAAL